MLINNSDGGGIPIPLPRNVNGMAFGGLFREGERPRFPFWMHKRDDEPVLVHNSKEEENAKADGYDYITASQLSNRYLINWFWDLEDMSVNQLNVFAKEEYGVDLPTEAGQEKLFQAVCELTRAAPQNKNRLILMAHTIKMNYDETLEEIRRVMDHPSGAVVEHESFEVML